jgi:hypothetical protein
LKKQITSFSAVQTGKVFAALYFVFSIPFVILMALMLPFSKGASPFSGLFLIALPILYAMMGFVFVALGAVLYNFVAKRVGGIEYTTSE